jgi:hypothetical protein
MAGRSPAGPSRPGPIEGPDGGRFYVDIHLSDLQHSQLGLDAVDTRAHLQAVSSIVRLARPTGCITPSMRLTTLGCDYPRSRPYHSVLATPGRGCSRVIAALMTICR